VLARVSAYKQALEAQVLAKVERLAAGEITAESVTRQRVAHSAK
jgi:hypothetical protein